MNREEARKKMPMMNRLNFRQIDHRNFCRNFREVSWEDFEKIESYESLYDIDKHLKERGI